MIIALISGKGSPGASAAALSMTLAWPRPVLLIEADPAGGSLVLGYAAGTNVGSRNLTGVRVAARRSGMVDAIWANVVTLDESRWLLPGAETSRHAEAVDYAAVAAALADLGVDVIVDAGRVPAPVRHDPLWATADVVLVATRSTLPAVHSAQTAAAVAREILGAADLVGGAGSVLGSVIIGAGRPYSERDIRAAMADIAPVAGVLAWSPPAACALVDALPAPRSIASTPLMRSSARLAKSLAQQAEPDMAGAGHSEHGRAVSAAMAVRSPGDSGLQPDHRVAAAGTTARHSSRAPAATTARTGGAS